MTTKDRLISGDNHIDLTYCPPDLWSSQAPAKWKLLVPRVEELDDGLHWFVEGQDKGMWNGIGPGFSKYQQGMFAHIDVMQAYGFEWDYTPGAQPRPTTPELRLADLDRDGLDAERGKKLGELARLALVVGRNDDPVAALDAESRERRRAGGPPAVHRIC